MNADEQDSCSCQLPRKDYVKEQGFTFCDHHNHKRCIHTEIVRSTCTRSRLAYAHTTRLQSDSETDLLSSRELDFSSTLTPGNFTSESNPALNKVISLVAENTAHMTLDTVAKLPETGNHKQSPLLAQGLGRTPSIHCS